MTIPGDRSVKWLTRIVAVVFAVVFVFWVFARSTRSEVAVAVAETGTAIDTATGTCSVYASADANVETSRAAVIESVAVEIGDFVRKGDVIARQRDFDLEVNLAQTRIRLEAARERLAIENPVEFDVANLRDQIAGTRLAIDMQQVAGSVLTQQERELSKRLSQAAYEQVSETETVAFLEEELKRLEYQLEQMTLRAPIDGTVVELTVYGGLYVGYRAKVARIVGDERFYEVTLSEEDFSNVKVGLPALVRLAGIPDKTFSAEIMRVEQFADRDAKTRKVFLDAENPDPDLVPGLTGEAVIYKSERADAVLVPRQALIGDRVYVVEDGRVEVRRVVPGFISLRSAEIRSGVTAGERVMVSGFDRVSDGSRVRTVR